MIRSHLYVGPVKRGSVRSERKKTMEKINCVKMCRFGANWPLSRKVWTTSVIKQRYPQIRVIKQFHISATLNTHIFIHQTTHRPPYAHPRECVQSTGWISVRCVAEGACKGVDQGMWSSRSRTVSTSFEIFCRSTDKPNPRTRYLTPNIATVLVSAQNSIITRIQLIEFAN